MQEVLIILVVLFEQGRGVQGIGTFALTAAALDQLHADVEGVGDPAGWAGRQMRSGER